MYLCIPPSTGCVYVLRVKRTQHNRSQKGLRDRIDVLCYSVGTKMYDLTKSQESMHLNGSGFAQTAAAIGERTGYPKPFSFLRSTLRTGPFPTTQTYIYRSSREDVAIVSQPCFKVNESQTGFDEDRNNATGLLPARRCWRIQFCRHMPIHLHVVLLRHKMYRVLRQ